MQDSTRPLDESIRSAAKRLTGAQRRAFTAEASARLCGGGTLEAERRFGWWRSTVGGGLA